MKGSKAAAWLLHIACVLALCWPAIVNRHPFYFSDTTSYVRAADSAVYLFSGRRISTAWTAHYAQALDAPAPAAAHAARPDRAAKGNDIAHGNIMGGRSPYFGMALWVAYVLSAFWLFVLAQSAVAYALIRTTLRLFRLTRRGLAEATVAMLALLTSLPFFDGLLMPDALTAFGILAFLLLAIERGRLARWERVALTLLMAASAISHLTHIVLFATMAALLGVIALARKWPIARVRTPMTLAAITIGIGLISVIATNLVVEQTFGREPQLVPLLTARFVADGPGADYIAHECNGRFVVCRFGDSHPHDDTEFLWSAVPGRGVFLLASPDERRAMSRQDRDFALAVLAAYPQAQSRAMLANSLSQLAQLHLAINYGCEGLTPCWPSIPEPEHGRMMRSISGQNGWPDGLLVGIQRATILAAIIGLAIWLLSPASRLPGTGDLRLWLALFVVAMLVNAVLGGAVSEPQWRYQARIAWTLPFLAWIALLLMMKRRTRGMTAG